MIVFSCLLFTATQADAAINVISASITGGKLVLTGKSPTGTSVKLDNRYTARINTLTRGFRFAVPYLPFDCKVDLTLVGATAPIKTAVISGCGPAGPTILGRRTWEDTPINLQTGTTIAFDGFSFVPPTSGRALIRGRGSCTLAGAAASSTKLEIYAVETLAELPKSSDIAEVRVNEDPDERDHMVNWTFERSLTVSEGVAKQVIVAVATILAGVTSGECVGSVTVEVFSGNLPLTTLP